MGKLICAFRRLRGPSPLLSIAALLALPSLSAAAEVIRHEPDSCLTLFDRLGRRFLGGDSQKPVIHEIVLDRAVVETALPTKLTPYLQRPEEGLSDKLGNLARDRRVLDPFKRQVREHGQSLGDVPPEALLGRLVPENQAHTFAVAVDESASRGFLSFSPTSPSAVDDQVSKHIITSRDSDNTRAAGLLWRRGKDEKTGKDILCFNTDSGTFMKGKKRARAGLETPPSSEAVLSVIQAAFPATLVKFCAGAKGAPEVTRDSVTGKPLLIDNETIPPGYLQAEVEDAIAKDFEEAAKVAVKSVQAPPPGFKLLPKEQSLATTKNFQTEVRLITPEQLSDLPEGTLLIGLNDKPFVVSKNPHLNEANLLEIRQEIHGRILPARVKAGFIPVGYPVKALKKAKKDSRPE